MGKLQVLTRSTIEVENHATSAERLQFYLEAPQELDVARPPAASVPDDWPSQGALQACQLCARYRLELPLTLRGISFELSAGSKVGILATNLHNSALIRPLEELLH
jgi:ABC-type multidrug transport system fused ATPase/permease subunit